MIKTTILCVIFTIATGIQVYAQEIIEDVVKDADTIMKNDTISIAIDSVKQPFQKMKIDGVAAVIGENVILDSDVDIAYQQLVSEGVSIAEVSRCELAGSLFESKLYAHHAIQDSIEVKDAEVNSMVDQQLSYMTNELGTVEKVLKFYKKDDLTDFKKELFEINKSNRLSEQMRSKIIKDIEITPEEIREFFNDIPIEERPLFGTEIELAQIVIEPEITAEEEQKVVDRLNQFREDIVENGSSFATKAVLYSQDPGSKSTGGKYTLDRQTNFAKEFKDVAFSLQEEEVSEPFKTDFGWHIVKVDKIRGEEIDVRHILLVPEVTKKSEEKAKKLIDSLRTILVSGSIDFKEAAQKFSDEKETREDGGQLINPTTGDTHFELTKIDPILYDQVSKLKTKEVSLVIPDQDRQGRVKYKLITVLNRYDEHIADYAKDYLKIQELALRKKQIDAIRKWQEEKILDTYIKVNGEYRNCEYSGNWLKKEK
ncbi:peptidylprolyl isomerase [Aquimarina muelleri]|uniref:Peptidylprolyl isomerase n=1 Tax=Aquimarina muelleri TaxID=279356 RepID=A0A918N3E5_9FLAO|nr:peptidylprolyl isomerase [Aquimarina muelleri]MCX2761973.1 peptidylprolyl isomerase [Aquimarina muelleri]GGX10778.1 peptidylprolyl isomerase [Aquimarina muelleri]